MSCRGVEGVRQTVRIQIHPKMRLFCLSRLTFIPLGVPRLRRILRFDPKLFFSTKTFHGQKADFLHDLKTPTSAKLLQRQLVLLKLQL